MEGDADSEAYVDAIENMDSPTVESPTQHFAMGFADGTPYSQAGPPQKGRSDVSHLIECKVMWILCVLTNHP
jgi:hypothetical protein